jgi:hypothetical protein
MSRIGWIFGVVGLIVLLIGVALLMSSSIVITIGHPAAPDYVNNFVRGIGGIVLLAFGAILIGLGYKYR